MKVKIQTPLITKEYSHFQTGDISYVEGSIDGIITDLGDIDRLLEHKGINHFTFQRYWDKEDYPLDYFTQCCLYLRGLNVINPDLREAILLIKNKNTSAYLEYLIEYDYRNDAAFIIHKINSQGEIVKIGEPLEHITQLAFEKFAQVQECIDKKALPLRQYDIGHWRCEYCGWGKICWAGWEEEIEAMSIVDMLPEEIATMIKYRQELGGQKRDITKEYDDLSDKIKQALKAQNIKEGKAGGYVARIRLEHWKEKVRKAQTVEKLDIRKVKEV
jgi:hypothetical protein